MVIVVFFIILFIVVIIMLKKNKQVQKEWEENIVQYAKSEDCQQQKNHSMVCPHCKEKFAPNEAKFCFHIKDKNQNDKTIYITADKQQKNTVLFCFENDCRAEIEMTKQKIPRTMKFFSKNNNELLYQSSELVCKYCEKALYRKINFAEKVQKKPKEKQEIQNVVHHNIHNIVCPFCYEEFAPNEMQFHFNMKNSSQNNVAVYITANELAEDTKKFCENNQCRIEITKEEQIPIKMTIYKDNKEFMSSPIRVCKNCHEALSNQVGTYSSDNGLFLIGLRNSGKTVFMTSVINTLKYILPKHFGIQFDAYNKNVADKYQKNYYTTVFQNKGLPTATINETQLTYEVINNHAKKTMGITFSDRKGEISTDANKIFLESEIGSRIIQHSNYYILTIDINSIIKNDTEKDDNTNIINYVLNLAVQDKKQQKFLAVVLTKSDELLGMVGKDIFKANSVIYQDIDYQNFKEKFVKERKQINDALEEYLNGTNAAFVLAAENAFGKQNVNYFAVSALGHTPKDGKLGDIMPRRVEEPILWLLIKSGFIDLHTLK